MVRMATYAAEPPANGHWEFGGNGTYYVWMQANEVSDTEAAWVPAGQLGHFDVAVPPYLYDADMNDDPGWTLEPQWQYGPPTYAGSGPTGGATGMNIIGYNLAGNYSDGLPAKYATTPPIDCTGSSPLILRFSRWLRLADTDMAAIQVSTNETDWTEIWSASGPVTDIAWREMLYALPPEVAGSPSLRLRWVLASNSDQNDLGWNIDDVELVDTPVVMPGKLTIAPLGGLNASGSVGGPFRPASFEYMLTNSGETPLSWMASKTQAWVDLSATTGSLAAGDAMSVIVSINAEANSLLAGGYEDLVRFTNTSTGNGDTTREVLLTVQGPGILEVNPTGDLVFSGYIGGPFLPSDQFYTLTNSGESALEWTVTSAATWLDLSVSGGVLPPESSTNLTLRANINATTLAPGRHTDPIAFADTTGQISLEPRVVTLEVGGPPVLTVDRPANPRTFMITVRGLAGTEVVLESTDGFDAWSPSITNLLSADGTFGFDVAETNIVSRRFYRARVNADP